MKLKRFNEKAEYMTDYKSFMIGDVFNYLGVYIEFPEDSPVEKATAVTAYDVDLVEFLKEILLGKRVFFDSQYGHGNPYEGQMMIGTVKGIKEVGYKNMYVLMINLGDKKWYEMQYGLMMTVYDYDAENKTLHKKVELEKAAEKYNL